MKLVLFVMLTLSQLAFANPAFYPISKMKWKSSHPVAATPPERPSEEGFVKPSADETQAYGFTADDSEEFDPYAPDADEQLRQYEEEANRLGEDIYPQGRNHSLFKAAGGCYQSSCAVWAVVSRSEHRMDLFVHGEHYRSCAASTGRPGHRTPAFEGPPTGRIHWAYSSRTYPGGNYVHRGQGMGNMPFAVFFLPRVAIHGTPKGNWKYLGKKAASHGCIRVHPDCAIDFRQLVLDAGIRNVWISVQ